MRGEITREDRALTKAQAIQLIKGAEYGVLATVNNRNQPSTVALNHVMIDDSTLVFHSALIGEKIDNLRGNPHVSFFVVGESNLLPKEYSVAYTSAVAHGKAFLVDDDDEKRAFLKAIADKFVGGHVPIKEQESYIEALFSKVALIKMEIHHLTGKGRQPSC